MMIRPQQSGAASSTPLMAMPTTSMTLATIQAPSTSASFPNSRHDHVSTLPAFERSEISKAKAKTKDKPKQVEVRNLTRGDKRKAMDIARDP